MKLVSWNVNGIRAARRKGMDDFVIKDRPDVLCLQEIKAHENKEDGLEEHGYKPYWFPAEKKGYSGTAVYTLVDPLHVKRGIDKDKFDSEGRVITLEFDAFFLVNAYFPHSQHSLARLEYKLEFNKAYFQYVHRLMKKKPVILTGDFNVAHKEIDLTNPKANEKNAGFLPEEREWFTKLLDSGFIDTFREFDKSKGKYTWWSYRFSARARNIGWRIDYFLISRKLRSKLKSSRILSKVLGSDHCPIELMLDI